MARPEEGKKPEARKEPKVEVVEAPKPVRYRLVQSVGLIVGRRHVLHARGAIFELEKDGPTLHRLFQAGARLERI